jgi:hypothetical protein
MSKILQKGRPSRCGGQGRFQEEQTLELYFEDSAGCQQEGRALCRRSSQWSMPPLQRGRMLEVIKKGEKSSMADIWPCTDEPREGGLEKWVSGCLQWKYHINFRRLFKAWLILLTRPFHHPVHPQLPDIHHPETREAGPKTG